MRFLIRDMVIGYCVGVHMVGIMLTLLQVWSEEISGVKKVKNG